MKIYKKIILISYIVKKCWYIKEKNYIAHIFFLFFKKNLVLNCKEALKRFFFFSNSMQI